MQSSRLRSPENALFLKLSGFVLLLLLIVGGAYVAITAYLREDYAAEVNQHLYGEIATHTVAVVRPLVNGEVDTLQIQDIMHSMMVINPSVEVYLLRPDGRIITYVAPNKSVRLDRIDLVPVREFLTASAGGVRPFVRGDDPRHPERQNIFSAAEIRDDAGSLEGYVYIILSGEEERAVSAELFGGYVRRLGTNLFFLSLLLAFLVGLGGLRYLTRPLRAMVEGIQRFRDADYGSRIDVDRAGDFRPIAETFNQMADRIRQHIDQMSSVDRLRRELVANISHDLRTPLSVMQGFVETLLMKEASMPPEQRRQYLQTILTSANRLGRLISQLFEYSKLEAKQVEPQKEAFNVGELAQDVGMKFSLLAERKQVRVTVDVSRDLPLIFADLGLVERVLNNLMDNAIKFTPSGGEVVLTVRPTDRVVKISVADSGPGIPEEEQPFVFERYRKAAGTGAGNPGVGLGLAIVKKILELHDEGIQIRSRMEEGTTFLFQMPVY